MEKVTNKIINKCRLYSWRFSKDETDALRAALGKFPDDRVEAFIEELETLCECERIYLKERDATSRRVTFQREEKERMLRRFEKAREELLRLVDGKVHAQGNKGVLEIAVRSGSIPSTNSEMSRAVAALVFEQERLYYLMLSTATALEEISRIVQDRPGAPGRPKGEEATGDLVQLVARSFQYHFKKPSGFKRGPFFSVVQLALEACGLASEDPSRHIKAALKSL